MNYIVLEQIKDRKMNLFFFEIRMVKYFRFKILSWIKLLNFKVTQFFTKVNNFTFKFQITRVSKRIRVISYSK